MYTHNVCTCVILHFFREALLSHIQDLPFDGLRSGAWASPDMSHGPVTAWKPVDLFNTPLCQFGYNFDGQNQTYHIITLLTSTKL